MAITFPLSWPSGPISEITMTPVTTVGMTESDFTGQQSVYEWSRQYWKADITLPRMPRATAEAWICFMVKLRGGRGTFLMPPIVGNTPRGTMAGVPVVNGAGQAGLELDIRGLTANASGVLLAGDYIQLGSGADSRLHKVLTDVDGDASGHATLDIWPPLRTSPADGAAVIYDNPVGKFRLSRNENPFRFVSPQKGIISFSVREAL